jgi:hypothetical protein
MRQQALVLAGSIFLFANCSTNDKEIREGMEKHAATICACQERDCAIAAFDNLISYAHSVKNKRVKDLDTLTRTVESTMESAGECLGELIFADKHALKTWEAIGLAKPTTGDGVLVGISSIVTEMCACDSMKCFAGQGDRLGGYAELIPEGLVDADLLPQFEQAFAGVEKCMEQMVASNFE